MFIFAELSAIIMQLAAKTPIAIYSHLSLIIGVLTAANPLVGGKSRKKATMYVLSTALALYVVTAFMADDLILIHVRFYCFRSVLLPCIIKHLKNRNIV